MSHFCKDRTQERDPIRCVMLDVFCKTWDLALCEVGFFSHNVGPCVMIMMSVGPFVKRNELLKEFNVLYSVRLDVFRNF